MKRLPNLHEVKGYFDVLHVPPGCSLEVLKQGYKKQVRFWHPDRLPQDRPEANERLRLINEAFSYLSTHYAEFTPQSFAETNGNSEDSDGGELRRAKEEAEAAKKQERSAREEAEREKVARKEAEARAEKLAQTMENDADEVQAIFCVACGQAQPRQGRFCVRCGRPLVGRSGEQSHSSSPGESNDPISAAAPAATVPQASPSSSSRVHAWTFPRVLKWAFVVIGTGLLGLVALVVLGLFFAPKHKMPSPTTSIQTPPPKTEAPAEKPKPASTTSMQALPPEMNAPVGGVIPTTIPVVEPQKEAARGEAYPMGTLPLAPQGTASQATASLSPVAPPSAKLLAPQPVMHIYTTTGLFAMYKMNKHGMDRALKGNSIQVVGPLAKIERNELSLREPDDPNSVKCTFDTEVRPSIDELLPGMVVTVRGKVKGMGLTGSIHLASCELVAYK